MPGSPVRSTPASLKNSSYLCLRISTPADHQNRGHSRAIPARLPGSRRRRPSGCSARTDPPMPLPRLMGHPWPNDPPLSPLHPPLRNNFSPSTFRTNDSTSDWPSACEWPTTPKTKPSETVVQRRKNKLNIMSESLQLGQVLGQRQVDKVHPRFGWMPSFIPKKMADLFCPKVIQSKQSKRKV